MSDKNDVLSPMSANGAANDAAPASGLSRRRFLEAVGVTVMGVCVLPVLDGCEIHGIKPIGEGGAKGKILPYLTPTADFYEQFGAKPYIGAEWKMPDIKIEDWKLEITGLGFSKTVTYAEVQKKVEEEGVSFFKTLRCVFDTFDVPGLMSTGIWRGVPLRGFLPPEAELTAKSVKRLHCYGSDGFKNNLMADRVLGTRKDGEFEVMLITHLNGELLPPKHGGPVRILVHETYGFKNMKFIEKIELSDKDEAFGHYEKDGGYSDTGVLQVVSKVTTPLTGSVIAAGKIKVVGMAFSGASAIAKVEVTRSGETKEAKILPLADLLTDATSKALADETVQLKDKAEFPFRGVWVRWEYEFDASPGAVELQIRATNKAGEAQPDKDLNSLDGSTGIAVLKFTVTEKA